MSTRQASMSYEQLMEQFAFDIAMLPDVEDVLDDVDTIPYKAADLMMQFPQAVDVQGTKFVDFKNPLYIDAVLGVQIDFINKSMIDDELDGAIYMLDMYRAIGSRSHGQIEQLEEALDESGIEAFYDTIFGAGVNS